MNKTYQVSKKDKAQIVHIIHTILLHIHTVLKHNW